MWWRYGSIAIHSVFLLFFGTRFSFSFFLPTSRYQQYRYHGHIHTDSNLLQTNVVVDDSIEPLPVNTNLTATFDDSIKPVTTMGTKTIGVDYGCVRTGIAATIGYNPRPLAIFSDLDDLELSREIVQITSSESAQQIVVGMPYEMNGTETEQASIVREFTDVLTKTVYGELGPNCHIFFWDERCSSKEAEARQLSSNPNAVTSGALDADAACIILEHFFAESGEGAELVTLKDEYLEEVDAKWSIRRRDIESAKAAALARRMNGLNARKEAMARAAALEAQMAAEGRVVKKSKKKKKKK